MFCFSVLVNSESFQFHLSFRLTVTWVQQTLVSRHSKSGSA